MKQIVLAKDICSPSYLSKIENGDTTASKDVIQLLLKKLNIDISLLEDSKKEYKLLMYIKEIYKKAILHRDPLFIKEKLITILAIMLA